MKCSEVSALLDMLMDDELSDEMRLELETHAQTCPQCAESINATIEMKEMLSDMDDEVDVPLAAQAAWRRAVKQEAAKIKARKIYRRIGVVAAAAVVLVGIGVSVGNGNIDSLNAQNDVMQISAEYDMADTTAGIAVIESDGNAESESLMSRKVSPEPTAFSAMTECVFCVEDIDTSCGYISDLVAEYEGSIDEQRVEDNKANLYISLPSGNVEEFLSASKHLDTSGNAFDNVQVGSGEMTTLLLVLNG